MKSTKESSSGRRESLVDAAYALIAERGMEGLRTRNIAAKAGIHHATLHYYFPTKGDLVQAVADRLDEEFLAAHGSLDSEHLATRSVAYQIREMLENLGLQLREAPQRFLVVSELLLHARRDPATMLLMQRRNPGETRLRAVLEKGIANRELPADLDIAATMNHLFAFAMGLSMLMAKAPHGVPSAIEQFLRSWEARFAQPGG